MSANVKNMQLAPLNEEQALQLQQLTQGFDTNALHWLAGYAAGRAHALDTAVASIPSASNAQVPALADIKAEQKLTILYGSQTGNGQALAEAYAAELESAGVAVTLNNMQDFKVRQLKDEHNVILVVSTHGDGDPPDDAVDFIEQLQSKKAPKLNQLKYAVLALGDSSYPDFCITGQHIDARLAELGAQRYADCALADLDIEEVANPWWATLQPTLVETLLDGSASNNNLTNVTPLRPAPELISYNRKNPYQAELLTNQRITSSLTGKDVRHIELDLGESGLQYLPGDALGVWPTNPSVIVNDVANALKWSTDTVINHDGDERELGDWLTTQREITLLSKPFLSAHAQRVTSASDRQELEALLDTSARTELAELFGTHQLVDTLRRWPAEWKAGEFVAELRKLTPRMYSIASSQAVTEDEVHTTLARVDYQAHGHSHVGAASAFLANMDIDQDDAQAPIFIDSNPRFRLPEEADRDIIMIGPGTGIAPFRSFVQHRSALGTTGRNWLFFGAQHSRSQFLYQLEWQRALKNNDLQRLDLAFSRDQQQKIYVQHRMLEQGKDLYAWLENGAHLYVCGDAKYMAKDVDAALHQLVAQHGGKSVEQAHEYVRELTRQKRYLKDVY